MAKSNKELTIEEHNELLKDLCCRLPYNLAVYIKDENNVEIDDELTMTTLLYYGVWEIRPYLRKMTSMTQGEKWFYDNMLLANMDDKSPRPALLDWLNRHFLDYRGLIEMGLANEAPEDMYEITTDI